MPVIVGYKLSTKQVKLSYFNNKHDVKFWCSINDIINSKLAPIFQLRYKICYFTAK